MSSLHKQTNKSWPNFTGPNCTPCKAACSCNNLICMHEKRRLPRRRWRWWRHLRGGGVGGGTSAVLRRASPELRRTLFGNQAKCSKRAKNSTSWIWLKMIWGVHNHLLYHVQCTKTVFTAWFGCRSSESTTKSTRSGWFYLIKMAFCSKSLLTS